MPYRSNDALPDAVRNHLPQHGQDIFRAAFNRAWEDHADDRRREEAAHRIAWAAAKRRYVKVGEDWIEKD